MFDPYHKWLGILSKEQPPNHYRLLHLELFESDLDVIEGAADRAMGFVRQYQSGEHAALAAKLLNEIATARLCLLKPAAKAEYDGKLRKKLSVGEPPNAETNEPPALPLDDELSQLMAAPAIRSSPKSRRKKSKPSQGIRVAGGIVAALLVVVVGILASRPSRPTPKPQTSEQSAIEQPAADVVANSPKPIERTPPDLKPASPIPLLGTKPSAQQAGRSIDLFQHVQFPRDLFNGTWRKEGKALIGGPVGKLYLPVKVPDDYQLRMMVKRTSGNDSIVIGFPIDGRSGAIAFDAYNSSFAGLYLDGRTPNSNCTTRQMAVFRNNQAVDVRITVHPGHVDASVDGTSIVDWHGQASRLIAFSDENMTNHETPFVAVYGSTYAIESIEVVPLDPEAAAARISELDTPVDLMPLLDTDRDAQRGVWSLNKGVLHSPDAFGQNGTFLLPTVVPDEYTLSLDVELPTGARGHQSMVVGLVADGNCFSIPIVNDDCLGLEKIDGARWNANETRVDGPFHFPGRATHLDCTVTKQAIRMEVDGRTLIDWKGDFRRLSIQDDWAPIDGRKLFLGTETHFKFSNITLGPPIDQSTLPNFHRISGTGPVDLLSLIDPKRDALKGTWSKEATVLRVMGDTQFGKLAVPCEAPAEYKLSMRIVRESGGNIANDAFVLNVPVKNHGVEVVFDSYGSTVSGIVYDRLLPNDPRNVTAVRRPVISSAEPVDLEVVVRKTGIKVLSGDKVLMDWAGNTDRLSVRTEWGVPGSLIGLCSWNSRFRIEKLQLEAIEPTVERPSPSIENHGNLLAVIDPIRDSRSATWKQEAGVLSCPAFLPARIRIPVPVPRKYVLTMKVERKKGASDLFVGLVVNGHPCIAAIDGGQGSQAGLMNLDHKTFYDESNPTHRAYATPVLLTGQMVEVKCYVLPDTVVIDGGDREVLRWHGDARRFSIGNENLPPNYSETDRQHLWVGGWDSEFEFRELTLKPLDDDDAAKIENSFSGVYPTEITPACEAELGIPFSQVHSQAPADGQILIFVNTCSGRCLAVKEGKIVQGQYACYTGSPERWKVVRAGDDWTLINEKSGNALAIPQGAKEGTAVIEQKPSNSPNQRWEFAETGNHYWIRSGMNNLPIAVSQSAKHENAPVIQWHQVDFADMIWQVRKAPRPPKP